MLGAIILAVVIIVVIPVSILMSGGVGAAIIGHFLKTEADHDANDELIDLNG